MYLLQRNKHCQLMAKQAKAQIFTLSILWNSNGQYDSFESEDQGQMFV